MSVLDSARFTARVVLPTLAGGVIKRRPPLLKAAELTHADRGAIAEVRRLRARCLSAPAMLRAPGRSFAVVLSERDVGRLLADTPSPFSPASREKIGALAQFQPHGVLITKGGERASRRAVNERALDTDRPLHRLADTVHGIVRDEFTPVRTTLDWADINARWWRAVRRITFGDDARDDERLTDQLTALRRTANWAGALPRRRALRAEFTANLRDRVDAASQDSLAGQLTGDADADPAGQVPHWLFAFDAAGMATARTLAVLATHAKHRISAVEDIGALDEPAELPYLRACVLDTLRLWPTTPMILRESDAPTRWGDEELPAGTTFVIFTPYFHRDADRLPYADQFTPRIWLDGTADENPALVPFSAGPARCPGADLVLFTTSTTLATVLATHDVELTSAVDLDPNRPLPATLDNFSLKFTTRARTSR